jgi:hypothetical protein
VFTIGLVKLLLVDTCSLYLTALAEVCHWKTMVGAIILRPFGCGAVKSKGPGSGAVLLTVTFLTMVAEQPNCEPTVKLTG